MRSRWQGALELLVVDDGSPDGTAETFLAAGRMRGLPVRVVSRSGPRDLGRSIVLGIASARTDLVCVMDADLSHPPATIMEMLAALDGADGVVASRYAPGGRIASWPRTRRLVSLGATALARELVLTPCTDPVSGFFLFRRAALAPLWLTGLGHKPLVEILAQRRMTIHEVPYEFRDRERGRSKLGLAGVFDFSRLLAALFVGLLRPRPTREPAPAIVAEPQNP